MIYKVELHFPAGYVQEISIGAKMAGKEVIGIHDTMEPLEEYPSVIMVEFKDKKFARIVGVPYIAFIK